VGGGSSASRLDEGTNTHASVRGGYGRAFGGHIHTPHIGGRAVRDGPCNELLQTATGARLTTHPVWCWVPRPIGSAKPNLRYMRKALVAIFLALDPAIDFPARLLHHEAECDGRKMIPADIWPQFLQSAIFRSRRGRIQGRRLISPVIPWRGTLALRPVIYGVRPFTRL